jgi:hypothetical protein
MTTEMKNKQKIAAILIAAGLVCYIVNLVVYVPKFSSFTHALETWNHTATHQYPSPVDYGLDTSAFIISPSLICAASVLILIGGGYLLAVLIARIARQLGYLKEAPEITKE